MAMTLLCDSRRTQTTAFGYAIPIAFAALVLCATPSRGEQPPGLPNDYLRDAEGLTGGLQKQMTEGVCNTGHQTYRDLDYSGCGPTNAPHNEWLTCSNKIDSENKKIRKWNEFVEKCRQARHQPYAPRVAPSLTKSTPAATSRKTDQKSKSGERASPPDVGQPSGRSLESCNVDTGVAADDCAKIKDPGSKTRCNAQLVLSAENCRKSPSFTFKAPAELTKSGAR